MRARRTGRTATKCGGPDFGVTVFFVYTPTRYRTKNERSASRLWHQVQIYWPSWSTSEINVRCSTWDTYLSPKVHHILIPLSTPGSHPIRQWGPWAIQDCIELVHWLRCCSYSYCLWMLKQFENPFMSVFIGHHDVWYELMVVTI